MSTTIACPFQILSIVTLADGRRVLIDSAPQHAGGAVGWWADVRPVDDDGGYGDSERVSLTGATHRAKEKT